MAKNSKAVMSSALARALIESGVEHFDDGGMVAPTMAPQGGAPATSASGKPGFLGSLFGQNAYEAQLAPQQQTDYGGVINSSAQNFGSGYQNSQQLQAQQQGLADALLAQSQGKGPNPAQAALANATGQNVAQQSALMASSRGSGANAGLIARQAAQAGAGIQQNAAGQSALMQAQQQLAAQNALQQQQQNMVSGNLGQQGLQAQMFGTGAGAQNAQNANNIANQKMVQDINSGIAGKNSGAFSSALGGMFGGVGSFLGMGGKGGSTSVGAGGGAGQQAGDPLSSLGMMFVAKGGEIPDHMHDMASIYHPEMMAGVSDFRSGGPVPGQAQVQGDSVKNDTVPAMLSPKEVVLPRSITQAANAPDKAAEFVRHLQERESKKKTAQGGYEQVAAQKMSLKQRLERLEKMYAGGVA